MDRVKVRGIGGLGLQRQRVRKANRLRHLQGRPAVTPERPDDRPRRPTQIGRHPAARLLEVGADACLVLRIVLVATGRRIVLPGYRCWNVVALGIRQNAAVEVVAVRRHLNQARRLHLARLFPGYEVRPWHHTVSIEDGSVGPALHPAAHQGRHDRKPIDLRQREDPRIETLVAVIEADEDRLVRQRTHATRGSGDIVERDRRPARALQPVEELRQPPRRHRIRVELIDLIDDIVKGDRDEPLAGGLGLSSAGKQQQEAEQQAHHARSSDASRR